MMADKPTQEEYDAWTMDPANWRFKIFYYNPKDKRILPPKRNQFLGWTINFANPRSILAFLAILAAVMIIAKLIR